MTTKPVPTIDRPVSCLFDNGVEVVLARHERGHFLVYTQIDGTLTPEDDAPNMIPYATYAEARIDARMRCEIQLATGAHVVTA